MEIVAEYEKSCDRIAEIFSELTEIITTIKKEFKQERKDDSRLTLDIVNDRLQMVAAYENSFRGYKKRSKADWDLEKCTTLSIRHLYSFFRVFDNPFSGSKKWYQRIEELIDRLSEETGVLENILKDDSNIKEA